MKYKSNVVSVNVWYPSENFPRQYGCTEEEIANTMSHFERLKQQGKILDYEMYGFANFRNVAQGKDFGDRIWIKKRTEEKVS